ncbi:MAG: FAD-dependent monooxygenase [Ktedonobacteraceae bacterium]|nr:FAD-dependent monooxygenase [Ktedonobacteraceae bacterium]
MAKDDLVGWEARPGWQDPIVIVGAGPVGMSAALGLTHYGVPSIVLDDGDGPAIEGSRAIFMERHALEILGAWSPVGRQMAELGMTLTGGRVFFRDIELYKTLSAPPEADARYPRFVNMPQNLLERLQYEALQTLPCCQVYWRHKVTGVTQDTGGVHIEAQTPDGPRHFQAPYVLAADGPRSTLRRLLGMNFPGQSRDHHFLILDVRMELETPRERWFWFDPPFNPGRTALLHPQPDSIYRLDYQLPPGEDLALAKQPESLHRRISATVGERPYEIVWMSIYSYQQRMLEHFICGRVLFLGDAAHLMSPFGGRGLNSGIQDAWNLVWKLVLVRAGLAPEALLETYHDERHAAAAENLRLTDDTMRFLVPHPGPGRWRRDTILRLSLPFKFMRRYINAGHMSNPYIYRESPIISEDPLLLSPGRRAGARQPAEQHTALRRFRQGPQPGVLAPVIVLTDAHTGIQVSLLDIFGHSFVALYFCQDGATGLAALQHIQPDLPTPPLKLYLVTPNAPPEGQSEGIPTLLDPDGKGATMYHAGPRTLYLVRPDRYIAARRFDSDLGELPALLNAAVGE